MRYIAFGLVILLGVVLFVISRRKKAAKPKRLGFLVDLYLPDDVQELGRTWPLGLYANRRFVATCGISLRLTWEDHRHDPDRPVRTVIHELCHALQVLEDGSADHKAPASWYSRDGDSKPSQYPVPPDEAAWIASHAQQTVVCPKSAATWLWPWTLAACERMNDAAGKTVLVPLLA